MKRLDLGKNSELLHLENLLTFINFSFNKIYPKVLVKIIHKINMKIKQLKRLLKKHNEFHGYRIEELAEAEKRLKIVLPFGLKKVYLEFGRNEYINGHNYLIPPDHLNVRNGKLVFFNENQACYRWFYNVTEIKNGNFNIYGLNDEGEIRLESENIENFLIIMCCSYFQEFLFKYKVLPRKFGIQTRKVPEKLFGPLRYLSSNKKVAWYWTDNMHIVAYQIYDDHNANWNILLKKDSNLRLILNNNDMMNCQLICYDAHFKVYPKPLNIINYEGEKTEEYQIKKHLKDKEFRLVKPTSKYKPFDFGLPF